MGTSVQIRLSGEIVAAVAKMAYAMDLGSIVERRAGSSPVGSIQTYDERCDMMDYLYKVGDRVVFLDGFKIEGDLCGHIRSTVGWNGLMSELIGEIGEITDIGAHHKHPTYRIRFILDDENEQSWWAEQEWIEPFISIESADTQMIESFLDEFDEG